MLLWLFFYFLWRPIRPNHFGCVTFRIFFLLWRSGWDECGDSRFIAVVNFCSDITQRVVQGSMLPLWMYFNLVSFRLPTCACCTGTSLRSVFFRSLETLGMLKYFNFQTFLSLFKGNPMANMCIFFFFFHPPLSLEWCDLQQFSTKSTVACFRSVHCHIFFSTAAKYLFIFSFFKMLSLCHCDCLIGGVVHLSCCLIIHRLLLKFDVSILLTCEFRSHLTADQFW